MALEVFTWNFEVIPFFVSFPRFCLLYVKSGILRDLQIVVKNGLPIRKSLFPLFNDF